jgi:hypothetical protein
MWKVLDDDLLDGPHGVELHLRSARAAWQVENYDHAVGLIEVTCQITGGISDLFVPTGESGEVTDTYRRLLRESTLDAAVGDQIRPYAEGLPRRALRRAPAVALLADMDRTKLLPLDVALPSNDDPWHLTYVTALGAIGESPAPQLIQAMLLREDLSFDSFLEVRRVEVERPGLPDIVERLRDQSVLRPTALSRNRMVVRPARIADSALDSWLQDRSAFMRRQGSTIVVVAEPRSTADLCLTWNLRGLHGYPAGLPLAVPLVGDGPAELSSLTASLRDAVLETGGHLMGTSVIFVSESVPNETLMELARLLTEAGQRAEWATPAELLRPARPMARSTTAAVIFDQGVGYVPARTDRDRTDLRGLTPLRIPPDFELSVVVDRDLVPSSPLLRQDDDRSWERYTDHGASVHADGDELLRVNWPSGWTKLRAVCADHGVDAKPSPSGRTALALLNSIGELDEVRWLAHRPLLGLMYRKAASSGMSWWKERSKEQAAILANATHDPDAALTAMLTAIEEVSTSLGSGSADLISFSELSNLLRMDAARIWLRWAEERRLLLRGAVLRCSYCRHEEWRPMAGLVPPVVCSGCLRPNDYPFGDESLNFRYKLSESLRRAIENDSIYHLLVARSLMVTLEGSPVPLVGIHPGVDFARDGDSAEADVVVLMADGAVVPVEVKRHSTGFRPHDLGQIEKVREWFESTASILAVGDAATEVDTQYLAYAIDGEVPVRRLLAAEDWLNPYPVVTMDGSMPGPQSVLDELAKREAEPAATDDPPSTGRSPAPFWRRRGQTAQEWDDDFAAEVVRLRPGQPPQDSIATRIGQASAPES